MPLDRLLPFVPYFYGYIFVYFKVTHESSQLDAKRRVVIIVVFLICNIVTTKNEHRIDITQATVCTPTTPQPSRFSLHSHGSGLRFNFVDVTNHVERTLWKFIVLTIDDLLETFNCVF